MDKYTKIILTVIAVLLALHLVKPWLIPRQARADLGEIVNVNVAKVAGKEISVHKFDVGTANSGIPVVVTRIKR